ncbi:29627_t:CDS:1, partial [Racocetra persica]
MSRRNTRNLAITRNDSTVFNESIETVAMSSSQNQETQSLDMNIDPQTKTYIDAVIQTTTASVMQTMQLYMECQFKSQRDWNTRCMKTINQRFAQLEQMNLQNNRNDSNQSNSNQNNDNPNNSNQNNSNQSSNTSQPTIEIDQQNSAEVQRITGISQGNYPPSPVINELIARVSLEGQEHKIMDKT